MNLPYHNKSRPDYSSGVSAALAKNEPYDDENRHSSETSASKFPGSDP
jgi:hypothetical protein